MRKILITLASFGILVLSFAAIKPPIPSSNFKIDNLFFAQGSYIFVHAPLQIAAGSISSAQVSYDSRYIAYLNDPIANQSASFVPVTDLYDENIDPGPRRSAYIYDLKSGQTTQILNIEGQNIKPTKFQWLPQSPYLYIEYTRDQRTINCVINASNSSKTFLPDVTAENASESIWFLSSTNEVVRVQDTSTDEQIVSTLTFINLQSGNQRTLTLDDHDSYDFWSDGKKLFVGGDRYDYEDDPEDDVAFEVDLTTGTIAPGKLSYDFSRTTYSVEFGTNYCTITGEYLENSAEPKFSEYETLLSTEGLAGEATYDRKFVFYATRAGLFLSKLQPFSADQILQTFGPALKAKALSTAKQVGIGNAIYCADYDDKFPLANNFADAILPYIKNQHLITGFQYMMDGELATEIEDISDKVLGKIETPFGTAFVFADTSVKWQNWDEPKTNIQF